MLVNAGDEEKCEFLSGPEQVWNTACTDLNGTVSVTEQEKSILPGIKSRVLHNKYSVRVREGG